MVVKYYWTRNWSCDSYFAARMAHAKNGCLRDQGTEEKSALGVCSVDKRRRLNPSHAWGSNVEFDKWRSSMEGSYSAIWLFFCAFGVVERSCAPWRKLFNGPLFDLWR